MLSWLRHLESKARIKTLQKKRQRPCREEHRKSKPLYRPRKRRLKMHWIRQKPGHVKNHWGVKSALPAAEQQPGTAKPTVTEPAKPWPCKWHPTEEHLPAAPALPVHPAAQASISPPGHGIPPHLLPPEPLLPPEKAGTELESAAPFPEHSSQWRAGTVRTAVARAVIRRQGEAEGSTKAVATSAQKRLHCSTPASASTVCSWRAFQTMQPSHQSQVLQGTGW